MRWVYEHPTEASDLGQRAKQAAEETLSMLAAGRRFAALEEIHNLTNQVDNFPSLLSLDSK